MKPSAKVTITDIAYKDKVFLIGIKVSADGYDFKKAYSIRPENGPIDVKTFKENIRRDIIEEVRIRTAIKPIEALKEKEFIIEYGNDTKTDQS